MGGAAERPDECRNHPKGTGISAPSKLRKRLLRKEGPTSVRDRSSTIASLIGSSQSRGGSGSGECVADPSRCRPGYTSGRAIRDPAKATRQRSGQPGVMEGPVAGSASAAAAGGTEPGLDQGV